MKVPYHIRLCFVGIFPDTGLKNRPYIWNWYLQFRYLKWPLNYWLYHGMVWIVYSWVCPHDWSWFCGDTHGEERDGFPEPHKCGSKKNKAYGTRDFTDWWFQTFHIFHHILDNPSHWLICFKMFKTTSICLVIANSDLLYPNGARCKNCLLCKHWWMVGQGAPKQLDLWWIRWTS